MARRRSRISHAKEAWYIACILIVLAIGLISFVGDSGYRAMKRSQTELETHTKAVKTLEKDIEERVDTINSLRDDPDAKERYIRRKGYAKKGELIQEVPEPDLPEKALSSERAPRPAERKQTTGNLPPGK
jgi:cell division protein FtsB